MDARPSRVAASHPRLRVLIDQARARAGNGPETLGVVQPCDPPALQAAACILDEGVARPVLVGNPDLIARAADAAGVDEHDFEIIPTEPQPAAAARAATMLAHGGELRALMKGSLHTDELMAAVVDKANGLRGDGRISHVFLFDLPRYHKLLGLSDCVVNISPSLEVKHDILSNAIALLRRLELDNPKVAIIAAVETLNPAIPATVDAQELVRLGRAGCWPGATVEGSLGFDNAFSAEAARAKRIESRCAGDFDLMLVPDLNAGNLLYKSFIYVGGGECAGLVVGARVPVVLTSRADSLTSRLASVALAVVASRM